MATQGVQDRAYMGEVPSLAMKLHKFGEAVQVHGGVQERVYMESLWSYLRS